MSNENATKFQTVRQVFEKYVPGYNPPLSMGNKNLCPPDSLDSPQKVADALLQPLRDAIQHLKVPKSD